MPKTYVGLIRSVTRIRAEEARDEADGALKYGRKEETELGRGGKHAATPREHLMHLLSIGWNPSSPLIQRFVLQYQLNRDLEEWASINKPVSASPSKKAAKS